MTKEQPKIGDVITIVRRHDDTWGSGAGGKCPNREPIEYPFTGKIINYNNNGSSSPTVNLDGWGFALDFVDWEYKIEKVYEIY